MNFFFWGIIREIHHLKKSISYMSKSVSTNKQKIYDIKINFRHADKRTLKDKKVILS